MRRMAWKQCRSCSAHSLSMWPDSFARNALPGWMRSPRASSTAVTGCCASQSISSPGWSLRSSSAIATSRCAWPSPIGEETKSARLGRDLPRTQRRGATPAATKSRSSRLTLTGSRTWGPCPEPSSRTSSPPVASASPIPRPGPVIASSVPWITSTGQRTRPLSVALGPGVERLALVRRDQHLGCRLEPPADAVLDRLRRVRLGEHLREEELEEAAVVAQPVVDGCTSPSPRRCRARRPMSTRPAREAPCRAPQPGR